MSFDIKSMNRNELVELFLDLNQPKFRAEQLFRWLQGGVSSYSQMTNLPKSLRDKLQEQYPIYSVVAERKLVSSIDGTVKYLFRLHDGETIETVLMKYHHGYTVCISTQVGCRMGCSFCASGLEGKIRDLTASEMLSQIQYCASDNNIRVSNVVMMGMGEPLDNFEQSVRFLELVSEPEGLGIGYRHISLSTSGLVPGIKQLAELNLPITLSISLHAPDNDLRSKIMPINKKWNIEELLRACSEYQSVTTRRISFEYAMIRGVNDTPECAQKLAKLMEGLLAHVNLIPANPVVEREFERSEESSVAAFEQMLTSRGVHVTVRRTLGADINASCGQLRRQTKGRGE